MRVFWALSVGMLGISLSCVGQAQEGWFRLPFGGVVSGSKVPAAALEKNANGAAVMEQVRNMGQEFTAARVLWLDKQTNRRQTLVLKPDVAQEVGVVAGKNSVLSLKMVRCLGDYGAMGGQGSLQAIGQDVAWLEVRESGREVPWFAGWMFNTYPEVATLDHPRYDLQLLGCGEVARKRGGVVRAKPVSVVQGKVDEGQDSEAPVGDTEAPSDDPFYVKGVAPAQDSADVEPQAGPVVNEKSDATDELHRLMDGR